MEISDKYIFSMIEYDLPLANWLITIFLVIFRKYRRGRAHYQDLYHSSLERTNQTAYYSIMEDHPKVER